MVWSQELNREAWERALLVTKVLGWGVLRTVEVGDHVELTGTELSNAGLWRTADHVLHSCELRLASVTRILPVWVSNNHGFNTWGSALILERTARWDVWQVLGAVARAQEHVSRRVGGRIAANRGPDGELAEVVLWRKRWAVLQVLVELGVVHGHRGAVAHDLLDLLGSDL